MSLCQYCYQIVPEGEDTCDICSHTKSKSKIKPCLFCNKEMGMFEKVVCETCKNKKIKEGRLK